MADTNNTDTIQPGTRIRVIEGELAGREGVAVPASGWLPRNCVELQLDDDDHRTGLELAKIEAVA